MASDSVYTRTFPSLTAVIHAAVKSAPSGLNARTIADFVGKPYQTLMSELSGQEGHKFGADLVLPLMDITGSDAAMHFLARERGGVYVTLPCVMDAEHPVHQQCMAAIHEFGQLMASTAAALEDGTITHKECDVVSKAGYEAIQAISALLLAMNKARNTQ